MEAVLDYLMPDLLTFYLVIFGGAFKKGLTSITDFFICSLSILLINKHI